MRLLVIPARGGSKRIPRKNVRPFLGKPMIAWSIEAAIRAKVFDRVIVSTDDDEISAVATAAGAEVPFSRPTALADDHTSTRRVVQDAIARVSTAASFPTVVGCLYATAPLVTVEDLRTGVRLLDEDATAQMAMTVAKHAAPIFRAFEIHAGRLGRVFPEYATSRSQDLPTTYYDAGQYYVGRRERWLDDGVPLTLEARPIVIPRDRAVDIDDEEDWQRAERVFALLAAEHSHPEAPCA